MVLRKLSVPVPSTNLENRRARAYCACNRWRMFGTFLFISSIFSWETASYRLKYCLKGPLNPEQPADQLFILNLNLDVAFCSSMLPETNYFSYHSVQYILSLCIAHSR